MGVLGKEEKKEEEARKVEWEAKKDNEGRKGRMTGSRDKKV